MPASSSKSSSSSSSNSGSTSSLISPSTSHADYQEFITAQLRALSLSGHSVATNRSTQGRAASAHGSRGASSGSTRSLLASQSLSSGSTTGLFGSSNSGQTIYTHSNKVREDDLVSEASSTVSRPISHAGSVFSNPYSLSDASANLSVFADSASLFSLSSISSAEVRHTKLQLWQSFLVDFGVCRAPNGEVRNILEKPSQFPEEPLDLPTSLSACESLIKRYLFLNLYDYMKRMHGEQGGERCKLYDSPGELARYTKQNRRYAKLPKVKEGYLRPFLRTMWFKHRLANIEEDEQSGEENEF